MESIVEAIKRRYSVRSYSDKRIEEAKKQKIREYIDSNRKGPLGNEVRFQMVDASEEEIKELKKLGTYGNTNGARLFIAGSVKKGNRAMEDFGYCMEKNILMATGLDIGTLWLGGSLKRSAFAARIGASEEEIIPAVTPLGYAAAKRTMMERIITVVAGTKNRKKFDELFFSGSLKEPLKTSECGKYLEVLGCVRLAPSASNKQPWRIVKEKDKNIFHLYLKESRFYNNLIKDVKLQNIDMGIAMCHFELSARELGLDGSWVVEEPDLDRGELQYIVSWSGHDA